jgi:hypothetical protein
MRQGNGACAVIGEANVDKRIFSRENLYALLISLVLIALLIVTVDQSPQWIYQGF